MKNFPLTVFFLVLFAPTLMAYTPAPKFDHELAVNVFGREVIVRHYEARRGWNGSDTDGARVGVTVGSRELIDLRRSTAILFVAGTPTFLFGFAVCMQRKRRAEQAV